MLEGDAKAARESNEDLAARTNDTMLNGTTHLWCGVVYTPEAVGIRAGGLNGGAPAVLRLTGRILQVRHE
jgi:hypothetical protein